MLKDKISILKVGGMILLTSILLTGCSNSLKDENNSLKKEITKIKSEKISLENKNKDLTNKLEAEKKGNDTTKMPAISSKKNIYTIYTANLDSYEKEADTYVYIPDNTGLKQKLVMIANVLSEGYFSNLPIEVVKIEEVDNKKIAVINLSESKENQGVKDFQSLKGKTWALQYFQGSAGGAMTTTALIETFLQRNHTGEWIDAVKFLYNNGSCDFQHAPELMEVNYRD